MDFPALNFDTCINCWWDTGLLLSHILNPSPFMSVFKLLQKVTILYSNLNYKKIHKGNQLLSNYEVSIRVLEFLHSRNLRLVIWAWLVWIHGWRSIYAPGGLLFHSWSGYMFWFWAWASAGGMQEVADRCWCFSMFLSLSPFPLFKYQ